MRASIGEKLYDELSKEISSEVQVIYILSRIRKILEIDGEGDYKVLKFYCNYALHAVMDDVSAVREMLEGVVDGQDEPQVDFFTFTRFHDELRDFLEKNNLPTSICDDTLVRHRFNRILSEIYTDTPLVIKTTKKTKVIWKGRSVGPYAYGGSFEIEDTH